MPCAIFQSVLAKLRADSWSRISLATAVVAVLLALAGAFGTDFLGAAARAAYWVGLAMVGVGVAAVVVGVLLPRHLFASRPVLARLAVVACVTPPMTVLVAITGSWLHHRPMTLSWILQMAPATLITTSAFTLLGFLVRRPIQTTQAAPAGSLPVKFLDRLPVKLVGAKLWAVEAQDHYLRLHTDKGEDLILMRLSDAIAELEGIEGARTHRSWWVARDAVTGAERGDGRAVLTLVSGAEVPVSRAYAKALRDAGWY